MEALTSPLSPTNMKDFPDYTVNCWVREVRFVEPPNSGKSGRGNAEKDDSQKDIFYDHS